DAQQAILVSPDAVSDAQFGVYYLPVNEAGGDFYDVMQISDDLFGYFVSDISGHDLGTSFATSALKALIRQNSSQLYSTSETIRIINKILLTLFTDGQHLTAVYGILDKKNMTFSLVNAAHPPILYLPVAGDPVWLPANSDVIGVFQDAVFETQVISVREGDRLMLYTDGLIETFSGRAMSREEGYQLLEAAGSATTDCPCQEAVNDVVRTMFADGRKAEDDVLLLGIDISVFRTQVTKTGFTVILPATFKAIDSVAEKVQKYLNAHELCESAFGIVLGCREALTNAVRHGSQGDPNKRVTFELARREALIVIQVTDQGPGFHWQQALHRAANISDEGGRGFAILHQYFDTVEFNPSGNKIVLSVKGAGQPARY
ncbi:MAG: SpoIIE family protein phosphatase, partial [Proteobacteria bacterium]|nr:SpoIIE family protein phosphatase [Pseudomonadota bacterium]